MAIPESGEIRASMINAELGRPDTALISIDRAENGDYGAINISSRDFPSGTNPARFSEWRGYNHSAGGPGGGGASGTGEFGYSPGNDENEACMIGDSRRDVTWGGGTEWFNGDTFTIGGRNAPAGAYSDTPQGGSTFAFWDGRRWLGTIGLCAMTP